MRGISFDGTKIPQLKKNNFGASFGRAIRKDKTFFYAVDEGLQKNWGLQRMTGCLRPAATVRRER
jgi:hypothetical protein